jgi:hypothetical protein
MLPKTGIYYLPDFKVTGFLKLIEKLEKHNANIQDYHTMSVLQTKNKLIVNIELKRQIRKMQRRKQLELTKIE